MTSKAIFDVAKLSLAFISLFLCCQCQDVSFQTEALAKKAKCDDLTKNDCLFYHEAIDKCNDVCQKKIKGGDDDVSSSLKIMATLEYM